MTRRRCSPPILFAGLTLLLATGGLVEASVARAVAPVAPQFAPLRFSRTRLGNSTLATPRIGGTASITNGNVLIAGGYAGTTTLPTTLELYNPNVFFDGAFRTLTGQLTTARRDGYSAPLPGGKVLIGGGQAQNALTLASAEVYDPATGSDTALPGAMTTARRMAWAAPLHDGDVLIGGGIDPSNNILSSAEMFDPTTGTFTALAQHMVDALAGSSATTLPDGRVLIAGGASSTTVPPTTAVEIYDPATGAFTKLLHGMLVPRDEPVVVALPDGKVLIAGGQSSPVGGPTTVERSAEIFDPEGSTSQELPVSGTTELTTARYAAAAALLPNGKVLIAGGGNSANQPLSTAELFASSPEAQATNPTFGNQAVHTTATIPVTITNVGAQNLDVEGFSVAGADPHDFSVGTSTCSGTPFGFRHTCKVDIRFTPSVTGARVAIVTLTDNEPVPLTFILKGTGTPPRPGNGGGSGSGGGGGSGSRGGAPVLSKLSITPRRFHAARGHHAGTTIRWHDTLAATTTLRIQRMLPGRRAHGRCVAVTPATRSHGRCVRFMTRGSLTHRDDPHANTLRFTGRLHGRSLTPGRYRLTLQALSAHRRSRTVTLSFTIVG